ncbi:MAG: TonB-dependent receptor [Pseudomonadota bacterium]
MSGHVHVRYALWGMAILTACAHAQETAPADDMARVVVSGMRASLQSSLERKRAADGVQDAVSAEESGKFPDTNVAEALQRVSGVAIERNAGEGQFITVRGLGPELNQVLVNGRMISTDNPGREFSFDMLSADLIARAEVYKSARPGLPEGGIGATIDVQTARPFDSQGNRAVLNASAARDSLSGKTTPALAGLYAYTNRARSLGVLASFSYTDRASRRDYVSIDQWSYREALLVNGDLSARGLGTDALTRQSLFTPSNLGFHREPERRKRAVANATLQARPLAELLLTADVLYAHLDQRSEDTAFSGYFNPQFLGVRHDANGTITGMSRPGTAFVSNNPLLAAAGVGAAQNDNIVSANNRLAHTVLAGLNARWRASEGWRWEADVSRSLSARDAFNPFVVVGAQSVQGQAFALSSGAALPSLSIADPLTDASLMRAHYAEQKGQRARDVIQEGRLVAHWDAPSHRFQGLDAGMAWSRRQKTVSTYFSSAPCAYCGYTYPIDAALLRISPFDRFLSGIDGAAQVPAAHFTYDPDAVMAWLARPTNLLAGGNDPQALLALPDGPYRAVLEPSATIDVVEQVGAAFVDSHWAGAGWRANVGVRAVQVRSTTRGFGQVLMSAVSNMPRDSNYTFVFAPAQAVAVTHRYADWLPAASLRLELSRRVLLRLAASRTLARPTLTSLGVDNRYAGRVGDVHADGGNPYLKAMHANNLDAALEWHPGGLDFLGVTVFRKSLRDFLETQTRLTQVAGIPEPVHDTRVRNGVSGRIQGLELAFQYTFERWPGWQGGFGVSGNYTVVGARARRSENANQCGYNGLSPRSHNAAVFYDSHGLQARLNYNWRASFLVDCFGSGALPRQRAAYGQADASLRHQFSAGVQLYLDALNLGNARVREYSVLPERLLLLEDDGRRWQLGLRFAF